MSLAKASVWTAGSTLVKIGIGLVVIKLLAVAFGPSGVGQAGNYRQLITVLGVLSGAGIFNGVTALVALHRQQPDALRAALGTSATLILAFSSLLAVVFVLAAGPIATLLFGHDAYRDVIRLLALLQMGIAYANFFVAILKGYRDAQGNALSVIGGSLLGLLAFYLSFRLGGYAGALVGLALVPALIALPAGVLLRRRTGLAWRQMIPAWDRALAAQLSKYTLMAVMTAVTLPVAYIMMRNQLAAREGWEAVGLWQGVSTISDAYLQFITASFTVYLLPTLARLQEKAAITREIGRALRFVLPVVAAVSLCVWLLRDVAVWLLFSAQFAAMRDLFAWQLAGDVMKVGAYVFGYLVIAKAALRFYALTEISQFLLLTGFSHWLIPRHGALGATQAYMLTYVVYFLLCCCVFLVYRRRT